MDKNVWIRQQMMSFCVDYNRYNSIIKKKRLRRWYLTAFDYLQAKILEQTATTKTQKITREKIVFFVVHFSVVVNLWIYLSISMHCMQCLSVVIFLENNIVAFCSNKCIQSFMFDVFFFFLNLMCGCSIEIRYFFFFSSEFLFVCLHFFSATLDYGFDVRYIKFNH